MPELPEVEVTRRGLLPHVVGRRIEAVTVRHRGLRWPVEPGLEARLARRVVRRIERRGKYLLLECVSDDPAEPAGWLLVHLGMTGTLRVLPHAPPPGAHDHLDIVLAAGAAGGPRDDGDDPADDLHLPAVDHAADELVAPPLGTARLGAWPS